MPIAESSQSTGPAQKPMILIVDDDFAARLQTKFTLENEGFDVVEAESGAEAIVLFRNNPIELVLLDVIMPEMDGFETCRKVRSLQGGVHTPIVMVTGLEDAGTITEAFDAGATDFISKPINLLILGYRVRYWLRSGTILNELQISRNRLFKAQDIARLCHWERNLENGDFLLTCHHPERLGLIQPFDYNALFAGIVSDEKLPARKLIDDACSAEQSFSVHYRVIMPDGSERTILNQGEVVSTHQTPMAVGIIQDITELKQAEDRIRYLAFYDHLTGLANRSLFREHWLNILPHARRTHKKIAVMFIDLDHFKRINDTLGHPSGDKALIAVAERLKHLLRQSDVISRSTTEEPMSIISRVGGDEFTIIAAEIATSGQIVNLTERIIEALAHPLQLENQLVTLTASIGVSVYPDDGEDFDTLLKNADTAMYEAKSRGRNNYQFFQSAMNDAARERFLLNNRLQQALNKGEFVLYYQPQFANNHGKLTGVEALIRWIDPERGLIPPTPSCPLPKKTALFTR